MAHRINLGTTNISCLLNVLVADGGVTFTEVPDAQPPLYNVKVVGRMQYGVECEINFQVDGDGLDDLGATDIGWQLSGWVNEDGSFRATDAVNGHFTYFPLNETIVVVPASWRR